MVKAKIVESEMAVTEGMEIERVESERGESEGVKFGRIESDSLDAKRCCLTGSSLGGWSLLKRCLVG